jgi:site-specific recombinase XerD
MTPLRQRLIDELDLRGLAPSTKTNYVHWVSQLALHYNRSPDKIADPEIKAFLIFLLRERKLSVSTLVVAVSALRFFYGSVLQRPTDAVEQALPRMKRPRRLPRVYSAAELERLFSLPNLDRKHRAMFLTAYAAGLRVSEVCHLRVADLLSDRCQILVVQGKGRKDRYTIFSPTLQEELRAYFRLYRPGEWLFPSPCGSHRPLTRNTVEAAFKQAVQRAGLPDHGGIHSLRHSFATHLLEGGIDVLTLQKLMGHACLSSTSIYVYVRQERLTAMALDLLHLHEPIQKF